MSQAILFYEPDDQPTTVFEDLVQAVADIPGSELAGRSEDVYRPFRWRDPATGVSCDGDLGPLPVEADELHPARAYPGWRAIDLQLRIPTAVPHWWCIEAARMIERLLKLLPGVAMLDSEDTGDPDDPAGGPGPIDRQRLLASWEQLHLAQVERRSDCPRMARRSSIAVWRYRRERAAGISEQSDLRWPEALVLCRDGVAHSATIWPAVEDAWAMPPVELLVLPDDQPPRLVPAEALRQRITADDLGYGGACRVPAIEDCSELLDQIPGLSLADYQAAADGEWQD